MKKIIVLLNFFLIILLNYQFLNAQTNNEKWIRLADVMEDLKSESTQKWVQSGGYYTFHSDYHPKSEELETQIIIKKIAYKKHRRNRESDFGGELHLQKIDGMNGTTPIYSGVASVSKNFDININGKKIKSKDINPNEEGWKIYEFDDLMRISSVGAFTGKGKEHHESGYFNEIPLLDDIYITLADVSDLKSQKGNAIVKEAYENLFISPQENGWTPENSERLSDGTIIEHYSQGVRTYKKPNGDFATFFEPDDIRDTKTLDLIKGSSLAPDSASYLIGAFKITQPNGVIIESDGLSEAFLFVDDYQIKLMETSKSKYFEKYKNNLNDIIDAANGKINKVGDTQKDIISGYAKKNSAIFKEVNNKFAFAPFFDITFKDFINPYDNFITEKTIRKYDRESKGNFGLYGFDYVSPTGDILASDLFFFDYNGNQKIFLPSTMAVIGMNDTLKQEGISTSYKPSSTVSLEKGTDIINSGDLDKNFILFNNNKVSKIKGDYILPNNKTLFVTEIDFENGDKYIAKYNKDERRIDDDETILTLPDGTKLENIEGKYRITHPDGSRFIGSIGRSYINKNPASIDFYNHFVQTGKYQYYTGVLTTADGKEYHFVANNNMEELQRLEEEREKERNARLEARFAELSKKYGEANILNALKGNVQVGMSAEMIAELGIPQLILDSQGENYAWFKMITGVGQRNHIDGTASVVPTYRYIKVDKKTKKIVYIGSSLKGY